MAFKVRFWNFPKKPNSTAVPAAAAVYTEYDVVLKGHNSILSPEIVLDYGVTAAPGFNYCYIPLYDRYYFVTDWTWVQNRNWMATLHIDVLGTYKDTIGAKTFYVLRSSAQYNPHLIDNYYPTETDVTHGAVRAAYNALWTAIGENIGYPDITAGTFIVGMVTSQPAQDAVTFGGVAYYIMSWSQFSDFVAYLTGTATLTIDGVSGSLQKFLVDPFQYIVSVKWFPLGPGSFYSSASAGPLKYYDLTISSIQVKTIDKYAQISGRSCNWTIPRHPQAATRGAFLKSAPFSTYRVFVPPFGMIQLDPSDIYDAITVDAEVMVDPINGDGHLNLLGESGYTIEYRTAQVGVNIPLAQITQDLIGGVAGLVKGVAGVGAALAGNVVGGAMTAVSGVISAAQGFTPKADVSGSTGSINSCWGGSVPTLYYDFQLLADEDLADNGRPLMENWKPSDMPGYIMVENGSIAITGTSDEADMIRSYLESGFFYE